MPEPRAGWRGKAALWLQAYLSFTSDGLYVILRATVEEEYKIMRTRGLRIRRKEGL
jgi:hypothetical protein